MGVEEAFGADFLAKYRESLQKQRTRRLVLEGAVKDEVMRFIRSNLKPETPELIYTYGNYNYDIVLVETPIQEYFNVKQIKFGYSLSIRWKGIYLGLNLEEKQVELLQPSTFYILIGKYKVKQGIGVNAKTFYNFNVHHILTMQEIANYKESQEKQNEEINSKVSSFAKK